MYPHEIPAAIHPSVLKMGEDYIKVIRRMAKNAPNDEEKAKILKEGMLAASIALRYPAIPTPEMVED